MGGVVEGDLEVDVRGRHHVRLQVSRAEGPGQLVVLLQVEHAEDIIRLGEEGGRVELTC